MSLDNTVYKCKCNVNEHVLSQRSANIHILPKVTLALESLFVLMYFTAVNHFCVLCREGHSQFSDTDLEDLEGRNAKPAKGKVLSDMHLVYTRSDLGKANTELKIVFYHFVSCFRSSV